MNFRKMLSILLSVVMVLSVCVTSLTSVTAETVPTIDGTKDDCYTSSKMIIISTAYTGAGGAATTNTKGAFIKTWFTWDSSNVYIYAEFHDPQGLNTDDLIYFAPKIDAGDASYLFAVANGGYFQNTISNGTLTTAGSNYNASVSKSTGTGYRAYEFSFPKGTGTGFTFNAVMYGGSYIVAGGPVYNNVCGSIPVKYDDTSTHNVTTYQDPNVDTSEPGASFVMDGTKDSAYTDAKCITVSTAYTGAGGSATTNTLSSYIKTWFDWDDDNIYIYSEFHDKNGLATDDLIYFAPIVDSGNAGYLFTNTNGGYFQNTIGTGTVTTAGSNYNAVVHKSTGTNYRAYEFSIPKGTGTGFTFSPLLLGSSYVVACNPSYNITCAGVQVNYSDSTSWTQTNYVDSNVIDEDKPQMTLTIDATKDDAYTDSKLTVISTEYAGCGGAQIPNTGKNKTFAWYTWDDNFTYVYMEMYGTAANDIIYFAPSVVTSGITFAAPGGWYAQNELSTGTLTPGDAPSNFTSKAITGGRAYEFAFEKGSAEGFTFDALIQVSSSETVCYDTMYYMSGNARHVVYEDNNTWYDATKVDPAMETEHLISLIKDVNDSAAITTAKNSYNALSPTYQALVNNANTLLGYDVASVELANLSAEIASDSSDEFAAAQEAFAQEVIAIKANTTLDDDAKDLAIAAAEKEFKFKNGVLNVRFQAATTGDAVRLVSTIDSSFAGFAKAGFVVSVDGGADFEIDTTEVYEAIAAKTGGIAYDAIASEAFANTSVAFITATIEGIPSTAMNSEITVKAFVETEQGVRTYGLEKTRELSVLFN